MNAQTRPKAQAPLALGVARCPNAPTTQEIIAKDKVPAPEWVRSESCEFLGDADIPIDRYTDAAFAKLEFETLWQKTWQFACREEHIPAAGDYSVYDIGDFSFIVTRVADNQIKAYYNSCLHRGTKLRASATEGRASEFKCAFHGWSWNVDGSLKKAVCDWDFPHVDAKNFALPEAKVEVLGGFVFINMDDNAQSLVDYFGPEAMKHINAWKLENRYTYLHIQKELPANWKLAIGAFAEGYHVSETHPQVAVSCADANMQYDIYGEHVDRFISAMGVLSPHLEGKYTEQDILDQFTLGDGSALGGAKRVLPEGGTARQVMADIFRDAFEKSANTDLSGVSDSELLDCFSYTVFPNTYLFPGVSLPMVYRFRPHATDHRKSLFEVLFMRPVGADGVRPEPASVITLRNDQSFAEAEGIDPGFARILDQDTQNLIMQQQGLAASRKRGITLGNYQEIRIRHFEQAVDKYTTR